MIEIKESHGQMFKVIYGTFYNVNTPDKLIEVLERLRAWGERIVLDYGNIETGESWGETLGVTGTLFRTTGSVKMVGLAYNSRSSGGGIIFTDCILTIKSSRGKRILYDYKN
jgi:hypothetical protein